MTNRDTPLQRQKTDAEQRQKRIGDQLRKLYDDVANEPVPDDFLRLLEEADDTFDADGETGEQS